MTRSGKSAMEPPPSVDIDAGDWSIVRGILRRYIPDCEVWAFGSRVTGKAKPYSDLDLAIKGKAPLDFAVRSALVEAFQDSDLPFKVDLVDLATIAPSFLTRIEAAKIVLQSGAPP